MEKILVESESEQLALNCMVWNYHHLIEGASNLSPEDFYSPARAHFFTFLKNTAEELPPETVWGLTTVIELLTPTDIGNIYPNNNNSTLSITQIQELMGDTGPTHVDFPTVCKRLKKATQQRKLRVLGVELASIAESASHIDDVDFLLGKAESTLRDTTLHTVASSSVVAGEELVARVLDHAENHDENASAAQGLATGFYQLDKLVEGLRPGQLVIVAARPGVGKTTLALDIMRSVTLRHNKSGMMFSLEMSEEELGQRLVSAEGMIPLSHLKTGELTHHDYQQITGVTERLLGKRIFFDCTPNITVSSIRASCLKMVREGTGLDIVVVDYLQLMSSGKKVESRQQEVAEFSRQLKLLAKELQVPIIVASQLNRNSEDRADRRPQVSDLRESGAIEQDADLVLLLFREQIADKHSKSADFPGRTEIIVGKNRGGAVGSVQVMAQLHYSRFVNAPLIEKEEEQ